MDTIDGEFARKVNLYRAFCQNWGCFDGSELQGKLQVVLGGEPAGRASLAAGGVAGEPGWSAARSDGPAGWVCREKLFNIEHM